ncbi:MULTISPECIES: YtzI protein [Peribacillus]|uniref:ABC transporter ATP-binding protein n=1 Tax=Peribacillus asahii TaxID=228899 RepID=A0A3Q9RQF1_9BACI|nr:YtzI protein [Peribacillus asahii]AZV44819.1 ABC transporter ATP-binding protein [Peribacillus asahii]USK69594.1 YtzI protein [Peribacillus asahii]USK84468.1 YtzI protein [Peribacillus asahii]
MTIILIVSILIILIVIFLSVLTVNKGYAYKHTIDPAPESDEYPDDSK